MDTVKQIPVIEIQEGIKRGDMDIINGVISQTIKPIEESSPEVKESTETPTNEQQTPLEISPDTETTEVVEPLNNGLEDILEAQRKYNEELEQKLHNEHERYLQELKLKEDKLKKEQEDKTELEKQLTKLSELHNQRVLSQISTQSDPVDDDEQYVSEYTKKTRQMVEELSQKLGSTNPAVNELVGRISNLESEYNNEKIARQKLDLEIKKRDAEKRAYEKLRDLQNKNPDLQTSMDIIDVDQDSKRFRKEIKNLVVAKNTYELEKAIDDYFRGGKTKELADRFKVKPAPDYKKYMSLMDVIDMKNGVKYDPVLGKEIPILDDEGKQVRYRSLEEAYRAYNYDKEIQRVRKNVMKEVSKKLTEIKGAAVTLDDQRTTSVSTGLNTNQEKEILNWNPKVWSKDPEKKRLVETVFRKYGLEVPRYRGK